MTQVLLGTSFDGTPMLCMFNLGSDDGSFPWHDWIIMIVPFKYEVGLLETPKLIEKGIGWIQQMLTVLGRMWCFTCIVHVWFDVA